MMSAACGYLRRCALTGRGLTEQQLQEHSGYQCGGPLAADELARTGLAAGRRPAILEASNGSGARSGLAADRRLWHLEATNISRGDPMSSNTNVSIVSEDELDCGGSVCPGRFPDSQHSGSILGTPRAVRSLAGCPIRGVDPESIHSIHMRQPNLRSRRCVASSMSLTSPSAGPPDSCCSRQLRCQ